MKKVLGFLMVTVLLWSCGSQFSRSKYGRYQWNRSHGNTEKTVAIASEEESKTNSSVINTEFKDSELPLMENHGNFPLENKIQNESENKLSPPHGETNAAETVLSEKDGRVNAPEKSIKKPRALFVKKAKNNPMQGGDVDAMWVLTLILCFIIPPVGVYLADGSITGLFWLTLVLCLLGGGFLFGWGGYFGGFYGLAIILALLRFFGAI